MESLSYLTDDRFSAEKYNHDYIGLVDCSQKYKEFCRPKLAELLDSLNLNVDYHKASVNDLYYNKNVGNDICEVKVKDFVSGYGMGLLGHNNPNLKNILIETLNQNRPIAAQASNRSLAGALAEKLNELIPSNEKYLCNFSNTGTEANEAAIKHAYMVWHDKIQRESERLFCRINDFFKKYGNPQYDNEIVDYNTNEIVALEFSIMNYNYEQLKNFDKKSIACAFKGSFHGKTTSTVKLTYNKSFRESFEGMTSFDNYFIDPNHPEEIEDIYNNNLIQLIYPEFESGSVVLKQVNFSRVFIFILEVIMGEGGVIPVSHESLGKVACYHDLYQIPVIIDEIQTGCGRTGTFFGYESTPLKQISPEYITLSKALGGGLVKIGATLIKHSIYDYDFGLLHTSTFCEDDLSCAVSLEVISMITDKRQMIMDSISQKGDYMLGEMQKLKDKYPTIIKEVRGKGLMLGIEFSDLSGYSHFFKYAGTQGFISMLVASYLLHYHNLRVLSPLSTMFKGSKGEKRKSVIRLQPSAYIELKDIDKLKEALDEVLNVISCNNEFVLLSHLIGQDLQLSERNKPKKFEKQLTKANIEMPDRKLGFIVHITELEYLINYYLVSFNSYQFKKRDLTKWWNKLCRFLEPDLMNQTYVKTNDSVLEVNIMCLPYLPKYMIRTFAEAKDVANYDRGNEVKLIEMQERIQEAAEIVAYVGKKNLETKCIGLGAYNSIVTDNAEQFNDLKLPVTTGNSYTTALMYQGIIKAAEQKNLDLEKTTVAIVGAGGNIGQAISELMALKSLNVMLIGRETPKGQSKLEKTKMSIYKIVREFVNNYLVKGGENYLSGLPGVLLEANNNEPLPKYKFVNESVQAVFDEHVFFGKLDCLNKVDIIAIATNSSDTWLVNPSNVKKGSIICCASVPSNLSEQFKGKTDDYFVFDSGYAKMPGDNAIDCVGMPKDGMVYGCLGETILMALDDKTESFSKGKISSRRILETIEMADKYGFELGKFVLGDHIKRMAT
ncbi:MAG: aminotransferase class III-fold pyridoxal phosphate-dependent enzyme [Marinilabiliaceae bacterium]|nr:aminotransferase class III-fold pyridoxal phosphate-dependent enzyme [Marinilabiliaceae bacterium]